MKKHFFACLLSLPLLTMAQYAPQEIKKNKISKMIIVSASDGDKQEYFYDRNGGDTAFYSIGSKSQTSVFEYNSKNQPVKRTNYGSAGSAMDTSAYIYKPDGSYVIKNRDLQFGLTSWAYYDKNGKITKLKTPDGIERMYTYNAKGQLMEMKTNKTSGEDHIDIRYSYVLNNKGQKIKEMANNGSAKWTTAYEYNEKGLISKITTQQNESSSEATYEYEFWQ